MKMDIEGSEVEVLPDLLFGGSLQHIDALMVEFHENAKNEARKSATKHLQRIFELLDKFSELTKSATNGYKNRLKMYTLDDESYFLSNFTLPQC